MSADGGGAAGIRHMTGPGGNLSYLLFLDAARMVPWTGGSAGTIQLSGKGTGGGQFFPVHGRILPGQATAGAGQYSDVVTVTVSY